MVSSLCTERETTLGLLLFLQGHPVPLDQGPTLMALFNLNHVSKAQYPNTVILEDWVSTYEFGGESIVLT